MGISQHEILWNGRPLSSAMNSSSNLQNNKQHLPGLVTYIRSAVPKGKAFVNIFISSTVSQMMQYESVGQQY